MIFGASAFALPRKGADAKQTEYQIPRFGVARQDYDLQLQMSSRP